VRNHFQHQAEKRKKKPWKHRLSSRADRISDGGFSFLKPQASRIQAEGLLVFTGKAEQRDAGAVAGEVSPLPVSLLSGKS
jgi:hypothetical protein